MQLLHLAALSAVSFASPQEANTTELPGPIDPGRLQELANALLVDEPGDGRTWARSATWKASFGSEGFRYIPFLGSDVPRDYPVDLDLARVMIDGEDLPLGRRSRSRHGHTVSFERGAAREVYHLTEEHVEQTFVFDELPQRGEIVLDLDLDTDLDASVHGDGFAFTCEHGAVSYGAATAVDARGNSLLLHQELTPDGIRIVVPSDFVAAATLPLVVDPVLSTFAVTSNGRRQLDLDVAFDGQNSTYQIVFSEAQSGADSDVIAVNYNASIGVLFPPASIDITSARWDQPRNASSYEAQQFLCVAVVGIAVGTRKVWGRTREATTGARGPQFEISGFGAEYVDVGGKGNEVPTVYDYMVVWQEADTFNQDFDIVAQAVNSSSQLTAGRVVIDGDPSNFDRFPSISKSSGRPGTSNADSEYMIVWERELSSTNADIHCHVIEYTGSTSGHSRFRAYSFSEARRPDVSTASTVNGFNAGERHWVIAFERRTGSNFDLFALVARDGDPDNARSIPMMQDYDDGLDHRRPRIAFDSQDYLVAYYTEDPSGPYRVHYTSMNVVHDGDELRLGLSERRQRLGASANPPVVAIASHWDGGGPNSAFEPGDAFLGWLDRPTTQTSDVNGAIVADAELRVIGSQYCDANVNSTGASAWIRAFGVTNHSSINWFSLNCSQAPLNSFGHFLCSLQSGFVPNPAGSSGNLCLQGSIGRFNRPGEILNSGVEGVFELQGIIPSQLPSPSGTVSAMSGQTWYFSTWFRDLGPTSNFSNGIEVTFD